VHWDRFWAGTSLPWSISCVLSWEGVRRSGGAVGGAGGVAGGVDGVEEAGAAGFGGVGGAGFGGVGFIGSIEHFFLPASRAKLSI
jgi:hypothetical protein